MKRRLGALLNILIIMLVLPLVLLHDLLLALEVVSVWLQDRIERWAIEPVMRRTERVKQVTRPDWKS